MISERVYRVLLALYPKEYRHEYGDLMAQLFRDRMRRDGGGVRTLMIWAHMIFDLIANALRERKEGADMRKLTLIGVALIAVALIGVAGARTIMAKSDGLTLVMVYKDVDTITHDANNADGAAGALQQAIEEGVITSQTANAALTAFERGDHSITVTTRDAFAGDSIADVLSQTVESGAMSQEDADRIAQAYQTGASSDGWGVEFKRFTFTDENDVAGALQQAVEQSVIPQRLADHIIQSIQANPES